MSEVAYQQCVMPGCGERYGLDEVLFACKQCGSLLDVRYDWSRCEVPKSLAKFDSRWPTATRSAEARANTSGVWRFRELLPFATLEDLVTIGEGQTRLQQADELATKIGVKSGHLFLQYEGLNPSGSFKDNGMAAAFTMARRLDRQRVACASTGNTSASLALYAGVTQTRSGQPMEGIVFVGGGKIAFGKLAQALDYGARTIQIEGDFDACMRLVQESADRLSLYLMNSVNPFRLEGQKTIMYRVLAGLNWEVPDWIICPGGNLGNSSAFGKAFIELKELGLIDRVPRLAIINATGANTLYEIYTEQGVTFDGGCEAQKRVAEYYRRMNEANRRAKTIASAIEINRPVNLSKALRSLKAMDGVVRQVSDEAILDSKALVGRYGLGCEPASGASVAGLQVLLRERMISPSDRVVCILTGHALKDPNATVNYHTGTKDDGQPYTNANPPVPAPDDLDTVAKLLEG
ncbi:MAG: threonine synthase [Planctomycetes bacterium]|nr:threonine synthase [Planctomycetota bacterium]